MSSGAADPITFASYWDVVTIGGQQSPGVCEVSEWKRHNEYDVKKGKGVYGATLTYVGRPPAKGTIKFYLWQPAHFQAWEVFRLALKYNPTSSSITAVDIYHPSLADVDIRSVVTESIGNIVHAGHQLYTCSVEFIEYSPPPKTSAVATPAASVSDNGTGAPEDAPDAWQQGIQQQLAIAQAPVQGG